ncbi:MAG: potassium/proton antiporter [Halieaceae bacterium]
MIEAAILIGGILLVVATVASRLADTLGMPTLLLFLVVGMLAGSEGLGGIRFDSPEDAQEIGTAALMVILFAGGLDTRWKAVRPVLAPGLMLSTVGVLLTALLVAAFSKWLLGTFTDFNVGISVGLTWLEALLIAAIISSTDAAAVFSVYSTSPVQPHPKLRHLLELESGSNDPMAVLLTVTILGIMVEGQVVELSLALTVVLQFLMGAAIGGAVGWAGGTLCNRLRFSTGYLYPMLVLGFGACAFGLASLAGGNSFLAVYVAGLVIGNVIRLGRDEVISFHNGLSWLMQIAMFVMLGLLVFPSQLMPVAWASLAVAAFLIFVARPIAVLVCYMPFSPDWREASYVSWVGLRGSVPIVLATFPATWGVANADKLFHFVFFIVITSVLVQGMTLVSAARLLGVTETDLRAGR